MKIGFFGNANNFPFMLARALRRQGHEILFIVDRPEPLHRPEHRYTDIAYPYPGWIREIPTVRLEEVVLGTASWRKVVRLLGACDAAVLNGLGPAAAAELPIPCVALLTGSDLELYADPRAAERYALNAQAEPRAKNWIRRALEGSVWRKDDLLEVLRAAPVPLYRSAAKTAFARFTRRQATGIGACAAAVYLPPGAVPHGDRLLAGCGLDSARRLFFMMADADWIRPAPPPHNVCLRVFHATRWDWKEPLPPMVGPWENKRGDILVEGLALFHHRTRRPLDLRFVEKGQSVEATKQLARARGIDHLISWCGELSQAEVIDQYRQADLVTEQFGGHVVGMAGYEAMAAGRPVLANGRPDIFGPAFGEPAPIAEARTPEEVARQLERLSSPAERASLGHRSRAFVERHLNPDTAARVCLERLDRLLAPRPACRQVPG